MEVRQGRVFIGRFEQGGDLLLSLVNLCKKEKIRLGAFSILGAVTSVRLGYYDQDEQTYVSCVDLEKKLEVISCIGNISLKELDIFVHAHITLADHEGKCYGGHLMAGARIFAAEYFVREFQGDELHRERDEATGLSLWKAGS